MDSSETITQADFADEIGKSRPYIRSLIKEGKIPVNEEGKILHGAALKAWEQITASRVKKPIDEPGPTDGKANANTVYQNSRAAAMSYKAKKLKLEYEEMTGKLIPVEIIQSKALDFFTAANAVLGAMPQRLAPLCEGRTARDIEEIIEEEVNHVRSELQKLSF